MGGRLQLFVIHSQEVCLCLLDIEQHLFTQLFGLLDPVELLLVYLLKSQALLVIQTFLQVGQFSLHRVPL